MRKRKTLAILLALAMIFGMLPAGTLALDSPGYDDIAGHYAAGQIEKWSDYGVLQGDGRLFLPDSPVTRAQMATVLVRLLGLTETSDEVFSDMIPGAWYAGALLKCAAAGIFEGNGDGTIGPNDPLTREQAAVILSRAFDIPTGRMAPAVELVAGATVTSSAIRTAAAQAIEKSGGMDGTYKGAANGVYGELEVTVVVKDGKISSCTVTRTASVNEGDPASNPESNVDPKTVMTAAYTGMDITAADVSFTDADSIAEWAAAFVAGMVKLGFFSGRPDGRFDPTAPMKRAELVKLIDNIVKGYFNTAGTYTAGVTGNVLVNAPATLRNMEIKGDLIIAEGADEVKLEGVKVTGRIIVRGGKLTADAATKSSGGTIVLGSATLGGAFGEVEIKAANKTVLLVGATIANLRLTGGGTSVKADK
ncbi:MAG TPA: S-layer homology domain-containing protein, partial [Terriglobales bacterium]|nr:S-layer homology domain-containing protein [Terriglobales bacterium]